MLVCHLSNGQGPGSRAGGEGGDPSPPPQDRAGSRQRTGEARAGLPGRGEQGWALLLAGRREPQCRPQFPGGSGGLTGGGLDSRTGSGGQQRRRETDTPQRLPGQLLRDLSPHAPPRGPLECRAPGDTAAFPGGARILHCRYLKKKWGKATANPNPKPSLTAQREPHALGLTPGLGWAENRGASSTRGPWTRPREHPREPSLRPCVMGAGSLPEVPRLRATSATVALSRDTETTQGQEVPGQDPPHSHRLASAAAASGGVQPPGSF